MYQNTVWWSSWAGIQYLLKWKVTNVTWKKSELYNYGFISITILLTDNSSPLLVLPPPPPPPPPPGWLPYYFLIFYKQYFLPYFTLLPSFTTPLTCYSLALSLSIWSLFPNPCPYLLSTFFQTLIVIYNTTDGNVCHVMVGLYYAFVSASTDPR